MLLLNGIVLILAGIGAMGFGLFLFYALLPLFYAFFGAGVGYWLGSFFTSTIPGEMSFIKLLFSLGGALVFASGAYFLEGFRRILIGIGLGSLIGGQIASASARSSARESRLRCSIASSLLRPLSAEQDWPWMAFISYFDRWASSIDRVSQMAPLHR